MEDKNKVTVTPTKSHEEADAVLKHVDIWDYIKDDNAPDKNIFSLKQLVEDDVVKVMLVSVDGAPGGCVLFFPHDEGLEVHTNLLKNCRGGLVLSVAHEVMNYAFYEVKVPFVCTYVFDNDEGRSAKLMSRFVGFKEIGKDIHPHTVNGVQVSRTWFLIRKEDWENQGIKN